MIETLKIELILLASAVATFLEKKTWVLDLLTFALELLQKASYTELMILAWSHEASVNKRRSSEKIDV